VINFDTFSLAEAIGASVAGLGFLAAFFPAAIAPHPYRPRSPPPSTLSHSLFFPGKTGKTFKNMSSSLRIFNFRCFFSLRFRYMYMVQISWISALD
jgi:hypothetical protein